MPGRGGPGLSMMHEPYRRIYTDVYYEPTTLVLKQNYLESIGL